MSVSFWEATMHSPKRNKYAAKKPWKQTRMSTMKRDQFKRKRIESSELTINFQGIFVSFLGSIQIPKSKFWLGISSKSTVISALVVHSQIEKLPMKSLNSLPDYWQIPEESFDLRLFSFFKWNHPCVIQVRSPFHWKVQWSLGFLHFGYWTFTRAMKRTLVFQVV